MFLQETFVIEDCIFYDPMTSNTGKWNIPSDVSFGYNEYSANGWKLGNASRFVNIYANNLSLILPFKISFKLVDRYSYTPQINLGSVYMEFSDNNTITINETEIHYSIENNKEYSFIVRSDLIEAYQNDVHMGTVHIPISQTNLSISTGENRYAVIKDFKVKAL